MTQPFRRFGGEIPTVVVKDDVHIVCLTGEIVGAANNLVQFILAVVVVEPLGYGLPVKYAF